MTAKQQEMIEYTTQDMIHFLMEDYGVTLKQAMDTVYTSKVFEKLSNTDTGLYLEGSAYVYEMLKEEGMTAFCTKNAV